MILRRAPVAAKLPQAHPRRGLQAAIGAVIVIDCSISQVYLFGIAFRNRATPYRPAAACRMRLVEKGLSASLTKDVLLCGKEARKVGEDAGTGPGLPLSVR